MQGQRDYHCLMILGPFRAPLLEPMPVFFWCLWTGISFFRDTVLAHGRAIGAWLSPLFLLPEAYLGVNGLLFSMRAEEPSLLPFYHQWPSTSAAGQQRVLVLLPLSPFLFSPLPLPIWHPPVSSPSFLPSSSSCLLCLFLLYVRLCLCVHPQLSSS